MKKIIRHKWIMGDKSIGDRPYHLLMETKCEKCGCIKRYDFSYGCIMYKWGIHIDYRAPSCVLPNTINYEGKKV